MSSELTNLLPQSHIKAFRRDYLLRLATVVIWLIIGIVIVQGVLLLPSYLYERQVATTDSIQLKQISDNLATTQEQQVQARLTALQTESTYLLGLSKTPEASTDLRDVLAVSRPGITLSGFSFTPSVHFWLPGNMQVSGIADTREDLRSYDSSLGSLPFVMSANLPISDYAKDTNIPFTITLSGSLLSP